MKYLAMTTNWPANPSEYATRLMPAIWENAGNLTKYRLHAKLCFAWRRFSWNETLLAGRRFFRAGLPQAGPLSLPASRLAF